MMSSSAQETETDQTTVVALSENELGIYLRVFANFEDERITIIEFCADGDVRHVNELQRVRPTSRAIAVHPSNESLARSMSCSIVAHYQQDEAFLGHLIQTYRPHVVIDRGSGNWADQLSCFRVVYPMLDMNAFYVIDNLQTNQAGAMESRFGGADRERMTDFVGKVIAAVAEDDNHHGQRWGFSSAITLIADLTASIEVSPSRVVFKRTKERFFQCAIGAAKTSGREHWELSNGGPYSRIPPRLVNASAAVLEAVEHELTKGLVNPPEARVTRYTNACVLMSGIVVGLDDHIVVDESLYGVKSFERLGYYARTRADGQFCYISLPTEPVRTIEEEAVLLKQWNDPNYGHWLVETFSRISMIQELFDLSKLRFAVRYTPGPMRDVYFSALKALGVRADQIIELDDSPVLMRNLIFPSPLSEHPWQIAPRAIRFLEELGRTIVPDERNGPRRVYVSRNQFGRRAISNEAELIDRIKEMGFVIVDCEQIGFYDQVRAFSSAEIVVGNQGAALTNLIFSPTGVRLLALTNEFMGDNWFWDIVCQKQGKYVSCHGRALNPSLGMQSDFTIDPDLFVSLLGDLISG